MNVFPAQGKSDKLLANGRDGERREKPSWAGERLYHKVLVNIPRFTGRPMSNLVNSALSLGIKDDLLT